MEHSEIWTSKLISAVKEHPAIYDHKSDKSMKLRAWDDVCEAMFEDWATFSNEEKTSKETFLRKKWKSLRDYFTTQYTKQKRRIARLGEGAGNLSASKWQYFHQLLFLKDIVAPRTFFGSLSEEPSKSTRKVNSNESRKPFVTEGDDSFLVECSSLLETETSDDLESNSSVQEKEICPASSQRKRKKRKRMSKSKELADMEARNLEYLVTQQQKDGMCDDSDMLFLKSLHPFLNKIPSHLKLSFRNRVQSLLEEYIPVSPSLALPRESAQTKSETVRQLISTTPTASEPQNSHSINSNSRHHQS